MDEHIENTNNWIFVRNMNFSLLILVVFNKIFLQLVLFIFFQKTSSLSSVYQNGCYIHVIGVYQ